MSLVLVTGATGNVGGAVARALLAAGHDVRAMVRDVSKPKALALEQAGAVLVRGDFADSGSVSDAGKDTKFAFVVTTPAAGVDQEVVHGCAAVDALAQTGAHILFSSVADAQNKTGIPHFDSKHQIEEHLRTLDVPWTSIAPAFFYDNVLFPWNIQALRDGVWRQALPADVSLQMISTADIGKFVAYVIANAAQFVGKHVDIAADQITGPQMADVLGTVFGRSIQYQEQSLDEVRDQFEDMATMYAWFANTGFSVDIASLQSSYPDVGWTSFKDWTQLVEWS